jgi:hypothetical protein
MYGLSYLFPITNEVKCIPMDDATVDVKIVDQVAHISLSQNYTNSSTTTPVDASYVFPIPAKAAVCAFNFIRGDGTKVIGSVKEKEEAKTEYHTALRSGQTAALGEEQTKDSNAFFSVHLCID